MESLIPQVSLLATIPCQQISNISAKFTCPEYCMTVPVLVFADRFSFCCWRFLAPGIVYQPTNIIYQPLWEQTVWVRRLWPYVEIMDNKNQWRNLATIHQLPITAGLVTCKAAHLLSKVWLPSKLLSTAGKPRWIGVILCCSFYLLYSIKETETWGWEG